MDEINVADVLTAIGEAIDLVALDISGLHMSLAEVQVEFESNVDEIIGVEHEIDLMFVSASMGTTSDRLEANRVRVTLKPVRKEPQRDRNAFEKGLHKALATIDSAIFNAPDKYAVSGAVVEIGFTVTRDAGASLVLTAKKKDTQSNLLRLTLVSPTV